jgi:Zn-dependent protease/predicted transcriptional regulator
MNRGGFRLIRIGGIEVIVDYSWIIVLAIFAMVGSYYPEARKSYTASQYWTMGAAAALLFFVSILIHELAHSFVAIKHGIRVTSIRLLIFGGLSQSTSEPRTGRHEFLIALSGPAASLALGMCFLVVYASFYFTNPMHPTARVAEFLAWANILLGGLNLIPGFPFDGGRILRAFLWDRWDDMARATKIVSQIGNGFALFLIAFGILQFLATQSLVLGMLLIFLGLFMKHSAAGSYQAVVLRRTLSGVQVRQVMAESVMPVDWLVSVSDFVQDYIYKHKLTDFPVFNRDEFVGMATLDGVKTVTKELWGFKQVRDIMTPAEMVACLKPADDVTEALSKMLSADLEQMPVMEDGRLIGIVSRRDIMGLFKIKSDLGVA